MHCTRKSRILIESAISAIDTQSRPPTDEECRLLSALAAPSFRSVDRLIENEWADSTKLYVVTDPDGQLESFFFVAWGELEVDRHLQAAVYLGLSATREGLKSSGSVRSLYRRFVEDAQVWEAKSGERLILWYTSATPSSCLAAEIIFAEAEPRPDGSFSEANLPILTSIRAGLRKPAAPGDHPYVVRGCFSCRRYSPTERQRIAAISEKTRFTLLSDLGVDETQGDRLLYICRVPTPESS